MYCDCSYTNLAESILSIYDLLLIDRNYIDYREVIGAKVSPHISCSNNINLPLN